MYVYMILMMSKEESNKVHFASRLIQARENCFQQVSDTQKHISKINLIVDIENKK